MGQSHASRIAEEEAPQAGVAPPPSSSTATSKDDDDDFESIIVQTKVNIRNLLDELPSMRAKLDGQHVVKMIDDNTESAVAALNILREHLQKKYENDPIAHTGAYRLQFHIKSIEQSIDRLHFIRRECLSSLEDQPVPTAFAPKESHNSISGNTSAIAKDGSSSRNGRQVRHILIKSDGDDNDVNSERNSPSAGSGAARAAAAAAAAPTTPDSSPALEPCQPKDNDVLGTRYQKFNTPGTMKYRKLIKKHAEAYQTTNKKKEKGKIARMIIHEIRSQNPPGRFLRSSGTLGELVWYEMCEQNAEYKIQQALHVRVRKIQLEKSSTDGGSGAPFQTRPMIVPVPFHASPTAAAINPDVPWPTTKWGSWDDDEVERLAEGKKHLGKDWGRISQEYVKTRAYDQCVNKNQYMARKYGEDWDRTYKPRSCPSDSAANAMAAYADLDIDNCVPRPKERAKKRTAAAAELENSTWKTSKPKHASAIFRGIYMRHSGKWQAQIRYSGQVRYIGVFKEQEEAAIAYEIVRALLKKAKGNSSIKPEDAFEEARRAALDRVNAKKMSK